MHRMFNGIMTDVIGRDGHVSETGSGNDNKNNNSGGGDDSCMSRLGDHSKQNVANAVGVFERHVTHYQNHVRDPTALTSSSTDALQYVFCRQSDQQVRTCNQHIKPFSCTSNVSGGPSSRPSSATWAT